MRTVIARHQARLGPTGIRVGPRMDRVDMSRLVRTGGTHETERG